MLNQTEILSSIKLLVKEEIPDAKVYLFGSRATGKVHEESDWDILILTQRDVDRALKNKVHEQLFSVSLKINDVIHPTIVNENVWNESAQYYVLKCSIKDEAILL